MPAFRSPAPPRRHAARAVLIILGLATGAALQTTLITPRTTAPSAGPAPGGAPESRPESVSTAPSIPTAASLLPLSPADRITTLAAALPHMQSADLLPLIQTLARAAPAFPVDPFADPPLDPITPLLRALLSRWVELDAPGMLTAMESPEFRLDYDTRRLATLALVEAGGLKSFWSIWRKTPGLARDAAREMVMRDPALLDTLLGCFVPEYSIPNVSSEELAAALGPEKFLKYAAATEDVDSVRLTLEKLAQENFSHALDAAKFLPASNVRDLAIVSLMEDLYNKAGTEEAPAGVSFRKEFEALPPGGVRSQLTDKFAALLVKENPDTALTWARSLHAGSERSQALEAVAANLPEDTSPSLTTRILTEAWLTAPESHVVGLPSTIGDFSQSHPSFPVTPFFNPVRDSFHQWHDANPAEAESWFQTVTQPTLRAELAQVLLETPGHDLSLIPVSETRLAYVEDIYFPTGPGLFAASPPLPPREPLPGLVPADIESLARLQHAANSGVSDEDWAAASSEERLFLSASALRNRAGGSNGPGALDFFNAMAPEERSLGAWYEAGTAYIKQDAEAASRWLESLPAGPERDAAATALVEKLTAPGPERDGEAAFAWATSMNGETERSRYLAEAVQAWAIQDPNAARTAVTTAALTNNEKQTLLRLFPSPGPQ